MPDYREQIETLKALRDLRGMGSDQTKRCACIEALMSVYRLRDGTNLTDAFLDWTIRQVAERERMRIVDLLDQD